MGCRSQVMLPGVLLLVIMMPVRTSAQCPAGFLDAGEISASVPPGRYQEVSVTKSLLLPKGIRIDESYRQLAIQAASDGAASDMRAGQIPPGFHLVPGGRGGGGWWSINNPKLETTGNGGQRVFLVDLYANTGPRTPTMSGRRGASVADVRVRVCIKTLP